MKKSVLGKLVVDYLGWQISKDGVKSQGRKLKELQGIPISKNIKEVRHFCGLANFLLRTTPMFSHKLAPFSDLLRGNPKPYSKVVWTDELNEAREIIIASINEQIERKFYVQGNTLHMYVDASDKAVGAVLYQEQNGEKVIIDIHSERLSDVQSRWSTQEREAWSIVRHLTLWRFWTVTGVTKVYSDHKSLTWLMTSEHANSKLRRWQLAIQEFEIEVIYVKGLENEAADYFSRHP